MVMGPSENKTSHISRTRGQVSLCEGGGVGDRVGVGVERPVCFAKLLSWLTNLGDRLEE